MMMEMQVEESMVHFPSPLSIESPTAFSPASFSGETSMAIDPLVAPSPLHMSTEAYGTADIKPQFPHGAPGGDGGYEGQLYLPQPPPVYPPFNLDEFEDIFGADAESSYSTPPPLESVEELPLKRQAYANLHPPSPFLHEHGVAGSPVQAQQRPRLQHSLSLRVLSSSQRTQRNPRPTSGRTHGQRDLVRISKPVFPTESVPLQEVSRRERSPSVAPSVCSTRSDPFDTLSSRSRRSVAASSEMGARSVKSLQSVDSGTGSTYASSVRGRGFLYNSTRTIAEDLSGDLDSVTKHCMEVEMQIKDVKKIVELDKKILKYQAERSKLVEKAQQNTAMAEFPNGDKWSVPHDKQTEIGRIHLFLVPIGIHPIDEPLYEEATSILRTIGGLYYDLERAIATLRNICCKGMLVVPDFSTCFAYIKSLLQESQKLQLSNNGGTYEILVDLGVEQKHPVPQEFTDALAMANKVLQAAHKIVCSYQRIQMDLHQVQGMARDQVELCESICQSIGLMDKERRNQIRAVLEGNHAVVTTAVRVWPHYYEAATETIKAITDCIHPSSI